MIKRITAYVFCGVAIVATLYTFRASFVRPGRSKRTATVAESSVPATELETTNTPAQALGVEKTVVQDEAVVNDIGASFTVQTVTRDMKGPVAPPNPHLKKK